MKFRAVAVSLCMLVGLGMLPIRAQEEGKKKLYIPNNPKAAAYILGRLSNKELVGAPRVEPVFVAFLERKGLETKYREEAIEGLAKLHQTDRVTELLSGIERLDQKGTDSEAMIGELGRLLATIKAVEISSKRSGLEALLAKAQQSVTRRVAYAGLIVVDGKADPIWEQAAKDNARLADLIGGVARVADPDLRGQFQSRVAPLAGAAPTPEILRSVIQALPTFKGQESASFGALAKLLRAGTERALVVAALSSMSHDAWPKDQAEEAARTIVEYASNVPAADRTKPEFLEAIQLGKDLSMLIAPESGKGIRKALGDLGVRVLTIKTLPEQMFFDKTRLVIEAGRPVEIHFENPDAMPHNFVVTAPGAREEIGALAEKMPATPDEKGLTFVPQSPKVLFATKLVEPGQKAKLSFTAPKESGEYTYVCTYPGHSMRMFGSLMVVADVEEFLAKNPDTGMPKITEWKIADFDEDIKRVDSGRNFATGKGLFTSLGCVNCHQLGREGNVFGPSLSGVFKKWKDDPKSVLQQILEPSLVIEEKFRPVNFDMVDDSSVAGIVLGEDAESVTVQTGPAASLVKQLKKREITSRKTLETSLMPGGLLSLLNKEQILDLLAYLRAEGNPDHAAFKHKEAFCGGRAEFALR